jgi:putative ATPase
MDSLFDEPKPDDLPDTGPLAERMRPETLGNFIGQEHLLGAGKALRLAIEHDKIPSMILWGPPGVGKTTLAQIIAHMTKSKFLTFSAVLSGIREIKDIMALSERTHQQGHRTILFVDEIHRFNKAQQDAFLPYVEKGSITLIGATTENPSFEVIAALLSRVRVFVLNPLDDEEIQSLVERAADRFSYQMDTEARKSIVELANGDARTAYNILELASESVEGNESISKETLQQVAQKKVLIYDKAGEEHYNIISALHKSIRNSDADAALYWLARMLDAGEDPMYVARRLVRFASEDVGLADPAALRGALSAKEAVAFLGMPEGQLALAECVIYLAAAPKSNAVYTAYSAALQDARHGRAEPVPLHLRNAPTRLMKKLHYGEGYQYAHDNKEQVARMECLPEGLAGRKYYRPRDSGMEVDIKRRLDEVERRKKRQPPS